MNFRIADTFTDSLVKLAGEEQKAVKTPSIFGNGTMTIVEVTV